MVPLWKKINLLLASFVVLFSSVFSFLVLPSPTLAQGLGATTVVADVPRETHSIIDTILSGIQAAAINAGARAVTYALQKVAYDSAVFLASGAKGQGKFFFDKSIGGYLQDVGSEAGGAALQELSKESGMNLCKPPNIKVDLSLKIGLRNRFTSPSGSNAPAKPDCTLQQFAQNWSGGTSKFFSGGSVASAFNATLKGDDTSDFGFYTQATEKVADRVMTEQAAATLQRQEGQGFKSKETLVSNQTVIPAQDIAETAKANTPDKAIADQKAQVNAAVAANDIKVFPSILSIFLSTLSSNLIKNWQNRGIAPDITSNASTDPLSYTGAGLTALGRSAAESFFSELKSVPIKQTDSYDLLAQLGSCPDAPGMYNCRAGEDLVSAVTQQLTIRQALDKHVLSGDRQLIPPSADNYASTNNDNNCYRTGYCLNNVKVLRQVRILPLGFEIAVSKSNPDKPWHLDEVVNGFNDCGKDAAGNVIADAGHPYCHLIDPNWVLKAPAAQCNALAYTGTLLSSDVPTRLQDCVDLQTCVGYDSNGSCLNYAYCTREKNTWKFDATKCSPEAATCTSFQNTAGQKVSYLYRTLDTGSCNQGNVGCTAYSLTQDATGNWVAPSFDAAKGVNKGIYFNKQLDSTCSANAAGCSAFSVAVTGAPVNVKKAPDYLNCYDTNPSTPQIDWPQTVADLNKIKLTANPACADYAQVCTPDEASCSWYYPKDGSTSIPGRFKAHEIVTDATGQQSVIPNDECDAKCVGYNAYQEVATRYTAGQPIAYIIPSSGQTCTAADSGCSSFTNLSTTTADMEKTEYYSYLRPCVSPSAAVPTKTFVTYEGSKDTGFQLKTYTLEADSDGSPKYFYKDLADLQINNAVCTAALYKLGTADPDCRQFQDTAGTIYYRLLGKTIPVAAECTPYRLNNPELYADANGNPACFQNGVYKDGSCFYSGLPGTAVNSAGTSITCSAAVETCRPYKGNTSNNIDVVDDEKFETGDTALAGWNTPATSISTESTNITGHSLRYTGAGAATKRLSLVANESYDLTFWAKGDSGTITIKFTDVATGQAIPGGTFGTASIGDTWNQYHFGPVPLSGATGDVYLAFANNRSGSTFLDNIRLVKIKNYQYLVKKSLHVDAACDSNPNDNLPGEALGCTAYTDANHQPVNLTGFSYLCRENAIGCTGLFDTHNNDSQKAQAYNVWFAGTGTVTKTIENEPFSCTVPKDQAGCYVNVTGHTLAAITAVVGQSGITKSTVYVPPAQTAAGNNAPIYLVADKKATCSAADVGCTLAGVVQPTANGGTSYTPTVIKNDPKAYSQTLCTSEAVGCNAFNDKNGVKYFKDPLTTGQKVCTYVSNIQYKGTTVSGWFLKDALDGIPTPCYPGYQLADGGFGLWSYGNTGSYNNYVGECKSSDDQCTEFIDHSANDQRYYFIKDDKLSPGTCDGLVSQRAGCALFDETDIPNKLYNTAETYKKSNANTGTRKPNDPTLVDPVVDPAPGLKNDANVLFQVTPDRECGEWLQCRNSYSVYDTQKSPQPGYRSVCASMERCSSGVHPGECGAGVSTDSGIISEGTYRSLSAGWDRLDYDGYSILNEFPLEQLDQVNVSPDEPDWRLVKKIACDSVKNGVNCASTIPGSSACDAKKADGSYLDKQPCGVGGEVGTCLNHVCVVDITGAKISDPDTATEAPPQICRAYSESDAPFPKTDKIQVPGFKSANFCSDTSTPGGVGCECDYAKVKYGDSLTKYYKYGAQSVPPGICVGGSQNDKTCASDKDCAVGGVQDGTCQLSRKQTNFIGWRGFCVETDSSRTLNADENTKACLTWYPIEALIGAPDVFNQHAEAGYQTPPLNGKYYCLDARNNNSSDQEFLLTFGADGLTKLKPWCQFHDQAGTCTDYGFKQPQLTTDYTSFPTRDDYWFATFDRAHIDIQNGTYGFDGAGSVPFDTTNLSKIIKDEIEQITLEVKESGGQANYVPVGAKFTLIPNDLPLNSPHSLGIVQSHYSGLQGQATDPKVAEGGYYQNSPNDILLFYSSNESSNIQLSPAGDFLFVDSVSDKNKKFNGLTGNLFKGSLSPGDLWSTSLPNQTVVGYRTEQVPPVCTTNPISHTTTCTSPSTRLVRDSSLDQTSFCPVPNGLSPDSNSASSYYGAWHALRFHFDPNSHQFTGIDTAFCDGDYIGGNAGVNANTQRYVTYKVTFKLRKWCDQVSDVTVNPPDNKGSAVAWTDRLWQNSNFAVPTWGYKYGTDPVPFGSLTVKNFNLNEPLAISVIPQPQSNNPASCGGASACTYDLGSQHAYYSGTPYNTNRSNPSYGITHLATLFANVFKTYSYSIPGGYIEVDPSNTNVNFTETGDPIPTGDQSTKQVPVPPEVHPLVHCTIVPGKKDPQNCQEGADPGFTINNKDGTGTDGTVVQAEASSLKAFMNFYMFADKNQMPIKQVMIDWGDGQKVVLDGSYRNQRGGSAMTCQKWTPPASTPSGGSSGSGSGPTFSCALNGDTVDGDGVPYGTCSGLNDTSCPPISQETCITNTKGVENCTAKLAYPKCVQDAGSGSGSTGTTGGNNPPPAVDNQTYCVDQYNHKHNACNSNFDCVAAPQCVNESTAPDFGHIVDKTCDNAYFHAENTYYCSPTSKNFVGAGTQCGPSFPYGCCIFTPRVQVTDNWGWCNGNCNHQLPDGTIVNGCYNANNTSATKDECTRFMLDEHWTYFGGSAGTGKVIVAPQ